VPDIIEFADALAMAGDDPKALLLGNGFSIGAGDFHYKTLLEKAGFSPSDPMHHLFANLGSPDFEAVVRALEAACLVESAYGNNPHVAELEQDAQRVREALVKAVHATHPKNREDVWGSYRKGLSFLSNFDLLFTLNYDLLLYWTVLERKGSFKDGFGKGEYIESGSFIGPFDESAWCNMFNLHGGLHLFQDTVGDTYKAINTAGGVISVIADAIVTHGKLPIYVAEGTTDQKMRRINAVPYLRHCYEKLKTNTSTVFVFGHSADDNDSHIYRAIFESDVKQVFFGSYNADNEELCRLEGQLARHQKAAGSKATIHFYRTENVNIWGLASSTPAAVPNLSPGGGITITP